MAQLEQSLFDSGMPVAALMEKAALAISRRLMQPDWWPRLQERGALVLVGPGHNGGDGLVVARELHLAGIMRLNPSGTFRHLRIVCPAEKKSLHSRG